MLLTELSVVVNQALPELTFPTAPSPFINNLMFGGKPLSIL